MPDNTKAVLKASAIETFQASLTPFQNRKVGHGSLSKKAVADMVAGYEGGWLEGYNAGFIEGIKQ